MAILKHNASLPSVTTHKQTEMTFPFSIFDHGTFVSFFGHNIQTVVTHQPSTVDSWIAEIELVHRLIVGFDIKWRPNFGPNINLPVATLQLCVGRRCLIFQLLQAPRIPRSLRNFLWSGRYTFVGVVIQRDAVKLEQEYGLSVRNVVDLRGLAADALGMKELKNTGLKRLAMEVLGTEIEKPRPVTLSDWDNLNLSPDQVEYACVDAFVSFQMGKLLLDGSDRH